MVISKGTILTIFSICLIHCSCHKNNTTDITPFKLHSEFFDSEIDTMNFLVYGKNPFIPVDSFYWVKSSDTLYYTDGNRRTLTYKVLYPNGHEDIRRFDIEPTKLSSSSDSGKYSLPVYKSYLLNENGNQTFYFEKDLTGKYTRFFSSKMVSIKTPLFNGPCIWSYLEFNDLINDSVSCKNIIDEYYGQTIGLVSMRHEYKFFVNGVLSSDSIITIQRR